MEIDALFPLCCASSCCCLIVSLFRSLLRLTKAVQYSIMDRHSFLTSLPFLVSTTSWPTNEATTTNDDSKALLLCNHSISIETTNNSVLFFDSRCLSSKQDSDPALSLCQVGLSYHASVSQQPESAASLYESNTRHYNKHAAITATTTACLCLKINDHVYHVNWKELKDVIIEAAVETKPACLILRFHVCQFRFFSLESTTANIAHSYKLFQDQLVTLVSNDYKAPLLRTSVASPCSTSHSGSNTSNEQTSPNNLNSKRKLPLDNDMDRLLHKQRARQQCNKEIRALSSILQLPSTSSTDKTNISQDIFTLMTLVADDIHASRLDAPIVSGGDVQQQARNSGKLADWETALNQYFPAPRSKATARQELSAGDAMEQAQKLVRVEQIRVRERHAWLELQTW
jgi:hypothetical protein